MIRGSRYRSCLVIAFRAQQLQQNCNPLLGFFMKSTGIAAIELLAWINPQSRQLVRVLQRTNNSSWDILYRGPYGSRASRLLLSYTRLTSQSMPSQYRGSFYTSSFENSIGNSFENLVGIVSTKFERACLLSSSLLISDKLIDIIIPVSLQPGDTQALLILQYSTIKVEAIISYIFRIIYILFGSSLQIKCSITQPCLQQRYYSLV